jgi:glyoxylate reductase
VFVTHPLRLEGGPELPLAPLERVAECRVFEGPGALSPAELRRMAADCDGLLCMLTDVVDTRLLDACPRLKVVSSCSVGVDHLDMAALSARGIPVGHTPGVLAETTAELAFALMLAAARRIVEADRFVRDGSWQPERRWQPDMLLGRDLHGATLGVVGLGAIGQAVARRAQAFGMRVLSWTPSGRAVPGVEAAALDGLLEAADFVSIHVALAPQTRGLIGEREFSAMKPGAVLVNTARGGIVAEGPLIAALESGRLAGAALDVFANEPLPPDDPLLRAPNLVLAPHIGSASVVTRYRMAELAVANLIAGLEGRPLPRRASP